MVSWDKASGRTGSNQRQEIKRLKYKDGNIKVRLLGDVLPRYSYWVTTNEGGRRSIECLSFDRNTETFNDTLPDPMKEIDPDLYDEKPSFDYACNLINRDAKELNLCGLKATVYKEIVAHAIDPDFGNPADPDNGYDITITREKTGPLPQNVKYSIRAGRNATPLTTEEKELELYDLNSLFKRPTYDEQKEWLIKNTSYFLDQAGSEFDPAEKSDDLD